LGENRRFGIPKINRAGFVDKLQTARTETAIRSANSAVRLNLPFHKSLFRSSLLGFFTPSAGDSHSPYRTIGGASRPVLQPMGAHLQALCSHGSH
jgi:hypothetical protein